MVDRSLLCCLPRSLLGWCPERRQLDRLARCLALHHVSTEMRK